MRRPEVFYVEASFSNHEPKEEQGPRADISPRSTMFMSKEKWIDPRVVTLSVYYKEHIC